MTLTVLGAGATFGELALVGAGPRTATVVATKPAETLNLRTTQVERLRREHPSVDRFLVRLLASYVRRLDAQLLEALYVPADKRVLRRLLAMATVYGDGRAGTVVPVTQEMLASMAGSTRPTANAALRAAEAAGAIAVARGRVTILDPDALARRAR